MRCFVRIRILVVISILICMVSVSKGQSPVPYPLKTTTTEIGLSAGYSLLFADFQLSLTINRRISDGVVAELKPVLGLVTQTYLFEGNDSAYSLQYGGACIGLSLGNENKFLELAAGAARFRSSSNPWGDISNSVLPIGTLAYKKVGDHSVFRVGYGFPNGLFIGFAF